MSKSQSKVLTTALFAAVFVFSACGGSPTTDSASTAPGAAPAKSGGGLLSAFTAKTEPISVPAGSAIKVTMDSALSSDTNKSGEDFSATVSEAVVVNGKTVIPKGATAQGTIVEAVESGRLKGRALLRLTLSSIEVDGKTYEVRTANWSQQGPAHTKRNTAMIGGGAGVGAAIGAIAGGGKGAAIGAAVGAGAGTAGAAATGKKDVNVPAEAALSFTLNEPVTVNVKAS